ncbi:hypothetical protein SAMN06295974_1927 [Plantibacter flavus]|uniref:DUF4760 domain-containing protein n=1 Tax=Plantibacter flavus TaxID=150123 RepID=A0A3N2BXX8_9MICO|nr:hypothetical protein [Plantibacter flavus]ROR80032.1 hypothetical protein EDD42_0064 [Plantibacter flavus]SMG28827.1 hypothetical protein SAMN06295974_1927 [Plantibacter flavus]
MNWFEALWVELSSPAWVAGLLQATFGTIVAFTGALFLFRRQLRHDRELVAAQLESDREARLAERRSAAADVLGRTLLATAEQLPMRDAGQYGLRDALWDLASDPPGGRSLDDAIEQAELILPRYDIVRSFSREASGRWYTMKRMVSQLSHEERTKSNWLSVLYDEFMTPLTRDMTAVGRVLVGWNGHGEAPIDSAVSTQTSIAPAEVADPAAYFAWRTELERELLHRRRVREQ